MNRIFSASDDAQTPLSAEEERDLKLSLSTRTQLNEAELLNIQEARKWAMSAREQKREDLASDIFARELHKRMFRQVWKWAGKYRTTERNLGIEAFRVPEAMRVLMDDFRAWLDYETYPLDEAAVRLHHRMVQIHPWPNGNGRHSRLMADIQIAANGGNPLTWGAGMNLASPSEVRSRYIKALQQADAGDLQALLKFSKE